MHIYLLDEEDNYLKLQVLEGNPFGLSWTSRVYRRDKSGKWVFVARTTFECCLRSGVILTVKGKNHKVSRFYIQKVL
jgi:hypothetical protein